eukprot:Hpha_TRINITY_DN15386_c0_g1::TRINITY_DN15386_c0_g1_i2::g.87893::m.87893
MHDESVETKRSARDWHRRNGGLPGGLSQGRWPSAALAEGARGAGRGGEGLAVSHGEDGLLRLLLTHPEGVGQVHDRVDQAVGAPLRPQSDGTLCHRLEAHHPSEGHDVCEEHPGGHDRVEDDRDVHRGHEGKELRQPVLLHSLALRQTRPVPAPVATPVEGVLRLREQGGHEVGAGKEVGHRHGRDHVGGDQQRAVPGLGVEPLAGVGALHEVLREDHSRQGVLGHEEVRPLRVVLGHGGERVLVFLARRQTAGGLQTLQERVGLLLVYGPQHNVDELGEGVGEEVPRVVPITGTTPLQQQRAGHPAHQGGGCRHLNVPAHCNTIYSHYLPQSVGQQKSTE